MRKRNERQELIKELVRENKVKTQTELVKLMRERGFVCTQATVSRDVGELGLVKGMDGCYILTEDMLMMRYVQSFVENVAATGNLVVIRTKGGTASGLAAAIDGFDNEGILGTVAGDDTVFVAAETPEAANQFANMMNELQS